MPGETNLFHTLAQPGVPNLHTPPTQVSTTVASRYLNQMHRIYIQHPPNHTAPHNNPTVHLPPKSIETKTLSGLVNHHQPIPLLHHNKKDPTSDQLNHPQPPHHPLINANCHRLEI